MPNSLIHAADFQLGAFQYGRKERENDYRNAMTELIDKAIKHGVKGVVLHGDTADMARERKELIQFLQRTWRGPASSGLKIYFMAGDHDYEKPTIPETLDLPNIVDAEKEFMACLAAGKPFKPYGEDGPSVAAFHYHQADEFRALLKDVRSKEKPENRSVVIWTHQSIKPGAGKNFADFDAVEFWSQGWHTVISGDIHVGGIWTQVDDGLPTQVGPDGKPVPIVEGLLAYCGSPEMTDINEPEDNPRGFFLVEPTDHLPRMKREIFTRIPYVNRPYKTFVMGNKSEENKAEILCWALDIESSTGKTPIIRVVSEDKSWERDSEIASVSLKYLYMAPKKDAAPKMVANASEVATEIDEVVYPSIGSGTVFQRLAVVLESANLSEASKVLGRRILSNPETPDQWNGDTPPPTADKPDPSRPALPVGAQGSLVF